MRPDEPAGSIERLRELASSVRLLLIAEVDGRLAAHGLADRSDTGPDFVAPRVLPEERRCGVGTALLERLLDHVRAHGFERARSHVDDDGSFAFVELHGFHEVDRQVEQVRAVGPPRDDAGTVGAGEPARRADQDRIDPVDALR